MEYIRKCNVCGNVWCYTDKDIRENATNSLVGAISAMGSIANTIGGTMYNAYEQNKMADRALNKVTDYEQCPKCNSCDTFTMTKEEYEQIRKIEEKIKSGVLANTPSETLIKKIKMFMEDKEWLSAKLYLEQVKDMMPENPEVYILSFYADNEATDDNELIKNCTIRNKLLSESKNFKYIKKFGDEQIIKKFEELNEKILKNIEERQKIETEKIYDRAIDSIKNSTKVGELENSKGVLLSLGDFKDSKDKIKLIDEKIEKEKQKEKKDDKSILKMYAVIIIAVVVLLVIFKLFF